MHWCPELCWGHFTHPLLPLALLSLSSKLQPPPEKLKLRVPITKTLALSVPVFWDRQFNVLESLNFRSRDKQGNQVDSLETLSSWDPLLEGQVQTHLSSKLLISGSGLAVPSPWSYISVSCWDRTTSFCLFGLAMLPILSHKYPAQSCPCVSYRQWRTLQEQLVLPQQSDITKDTQDIIECPEKWLLMSWRTILNSLLTSSPP